MGRVGGEKASISIAGSVKQEKAHRFGEKRAGLSAAGRLATKPSLQGQDGEAAGA